MRFTRWVSFESQLRLEWVESYQQIVVKREGEGWVDIRYVVMTNRQSAEDELIIVRSSEVDQLAKCRGMKPPQCRALESSIRTDIPRWPLPCTSLNSKSFLRQNKTWKYKKKKQIIFPFQPIPVNCNAIINYFSVIFWMAHFSNFYTRKWTNVSTLPRNCLFVLFFLFLSSKQIAMLISFLFRHQSIRGLKAQSNNFFCNESESTKNPTEFFVFDFFGNLKKIKEN